MLVLQLHIFLGHELGTLLMLGEHITHVLGLFGVHLHLRG